MGVGRGLFRKLKSCGKNKGTPRIQKLNSVRPDNKSNFRKNRTSVSLRGNVFFIDFFRSSKYFSSRPVVKEK